MTDEPNSQPIAPYTKVRWVGMGELLVYAVSEDELRLLESGGPASTFLNLAIFFASVGASFLVSLLLADVKSVRVFIVIVILTVVTLIAGFVMFVLWHKWSRDAKSTIQRIRDRARAQGPGQALTITSEDSGNQ
jgi:hypothetical protein